MGGIVLDSKEVGFPIDGEAVPVKFWVGGCALVNRLEAIFEAIYADEIGS